jgi:uncharacterized protein YoxC
VTNPLFWLVLSLLFVTVSLTIVLIVMIPTLKELGRAARSAEKLFETLRREFPPTLEAIRLTGMEITDLTEDISEGVQSAGQVAKQVDQTLTGARKQVRKVQLSTRSLMSGVKTAWKTFTRSQPTQQTRRPEHLLPASTGSDSLPEGNGTRFISKAGEVVEEIQQPESEDNTQWFEEADIRGRE